MRWKEGVERRKLIFKFIPAGFELNLRTTSYLFLHMFLCYFFPHFSHSLAPDTATTTWARCLGLCNLILHLLWYTESTIPYHFVWNQPPPLPNLISRMRAHYNVDLVTLPLYSTIPFQHAPTLPEGPRKTFRPKRLHNLHKGYPTNSNMSSFTSTHFQEVLCPNSWLKCLVKEQQFLTSRGKVLDLMFLGNYLRKI